ncbi:MAG TPA: hypothetical protein VFR07_08260 [Mycobacteriales bacterium]|jgi:hypothetical protein|nr:hypothetical protein [Mycobacteriales bacterium]
MRPAVPGALVGVVVLQLLVLVLPGVPTVEVGGAALLASILVLAAWARRRSWALTWFLVLEGVVCLGAVVALLGPTGNVGLGLLAVLAGVAEALAVRQLLRQRRLSAST